MAIKTEPERILISARCKLIRYKVSEALAGEAYQIMQASSGKAALDILSEGVSAMFLTEQLDDMDAGGLLRHINLLKMKQRPKILMMPGCHEVGKEFRSMGVDGFVYPPLHGRKVRLKLKGLMHPELCLMEEQNLLVRELRIFERFPVKNLGLTIFKPVHESTYVTDLCYSGLKASTCFLSREHVGQLLKIQLQYQGESVVMDGRIVWLRNGETGIRFCGRKPARFLSIFDEISNMPMARAI